MTLDVRLVGPTLQGLGGRQGRLPVCRSASGRTQGPSLPKDPFRGALSLGVSSKGVSEWDEK